MILVSQITPFETPSDCYTKCVHKQSNYRFIIDKIAYLYVPLLGSNYLFHFQTRLRCLF